jgi:hypothetical protein
VFTTVCAFGFIGSISGPAPSAFACMAIGAILYICGVARRRGVWPRVRFSAEVEALSTFAHRPAASKPSRITIGRTQPPACIPTDKC